MFLNSLYRYSFEIIMYLVFLLKSELEKESSIENLLKKNVTYSWAISFYLACKFVFEIIFLLLIHFLFDYGYYKF